MLQNDVSVEYFTSKNEVKKYCEERLGVIKPSKKFVNTFFRKDFKGKKSIFVPKKPLSDIENLAQKMNFSLASRRYKKAKDRNDTQRMNMIWDQTITKGINIHMPDLSS